MNDDIRVAIDSMNDYGYCVLADRIPEDMARSMSQRFLEIHADPEYQRYNTGDRHYQTLFGMLNLDDRVWMCASHPDIVAVVRHFLGETCRVSRLVPSRHGLGLVLKDCTSIPPHILLKYRT